MTNATTPVGAILCGLSALLPILPTEAQTVDDVRAIVAESISDADGRTSLLSTSGSSSASSSGFAIQGDGYELKIGGHLQFRYLASVRSERDPDDFESGFQLRRTRLVFSGTVHDDWNFKFQNDLSRRTGQLRLVDAQFGYNVGNGWKLDFGQFKTPFLHEQLVSGKRLLAVERSIFNRLFTQSRSQQVQIGYTDETLAARFSFNDGRGSSNSDFSAANDADLGLAARVDLILAGDRKQFRDFTSKRGSSFGARVGAAVAYTEGTLLKGSQTSDPTDRDRKSLYYTADASLEGDGWNMFFAGGGRFMSDRAAGDSTDRNDLGLVVQGGVYACETTEVFGRWTSIFYDPDRDLPGPDTVSFLTLGVNEYIAGHALKVTADAIVALNDTRAALAQSTLPNTGSGLLGSMDEGEVVLRVQMQLLF